MKVQYKIALFAAIVFFTVVTGYYLTQSGNQSRPMDAQTPLPGSSVNTASSNGGSGSILPVPLTTDDSDAKAELLRRQVNERLAAANASTAKPYTSPTSNTGKNTDLNTPSSTTTPDNTPAPTATNNTHSSTGTKPTTMTFNGSPIDNVLTPKPAQPLSNPVAAVTPATVSNTKPTAPRAQIPPPAAPKSYTIQSGDTLSSIALTLYGSDRYWVEIAQANPTIDPLKLKPGQTIKLPQPSDLRKPTSQRLVNNGSSKGAQYTVRAGDNLSTIAQEFYNNSAMWRRIYNANKAKIGANPDTLQAGVTLDIPSAESGTDH